jgi:hypothetical protein
MAHPTRHGHGLMLCLSSKQIKLASGHWVDPTCRPLVSWHIKYIKFIIIVFVHVEPHAKGVHGNYTDDPI